MLYTIKIVIILYIKNEGETMKKITAIISLLIFLLIGSTGCIKPNISPGGQTNIPPIVDKEEELPEEPIEAAIDEDGLFISKDEVALYIATYNKLPANYRKKSQVNGHISNDWTPENLASVGGDVFGNRERLLPIKEGRTFIELDINYQGASNRGSERIVYSNDGLIFYTSDHYVSFVLYDKETAAWKSY